MFYWIVKAIAWPLRKLYFRIRAEGVENLPPRGPAIVIANHASYLDAGVLGSVLPRKVHFLVLSAMYARWRIRWFYLWMETVPVKPGSADHAAIRRALQLLADGRVVGIFPEGSRSPDGQLRDPMPGAALLAMKSRAPVVPAHIAGAFEAFPPGRFWPGPKKIRVRFGVPFRYEERPGERSGREDLRAFTRRMMQEIAALMPAASEAGSARRREEEVR